MSGRLEGKVAVITGGTSGIGEATVELFVAEGAHVVLTGRSRDKGAALAERLGGNAVYFYADVTREEDIKASIDAAVDRFGKLDVLFNNAGASVPTDISTITAAEIEHGCRVLLSSVMLGIRHAIEPMKAAGGGSIINNSSIAGLRYRQGNILYSVLKSAVTHCTRLAGVELGPHRIRVNAISPGAIATPIFWGGSARANELSDEENARKMTEACRTTSPRRRPCPAAACRETSPRRRCISRVTPAATSTPTIWSWTAGAPGCSTTIRRID